ncbi:hypothetical protein Scep_005240 [Stephania cephalantha]|uniref:Uncharacterized protein n=1 Tax=Stephania cephalantha TaxID=152367 RepID=A0AAP0PZW6_9MAGN
MNNTAHKHQKQRSQIMGGSQNEAEAMSKLEESSSPIGSTSPNKKTEPDEESSWYCTIDFESDEEEESSLLSQPRPFVPSIEIRTIEGSLLINTVVLKEVSLTSALFRVLEDEKLDIVFENQYRSETKAFHTIQVRVEPDYNIDGLVRKLGVWAKQT